MTKGNWLLSSSEREYLKGEKSDYKYKRRIKKKVETLPKALGQLREDLKLLERTEYLDYRTKHECRNRARGIIPLREAIMNQFWVVHGPSIDVNGNGLTVHEALQTIVDEYTIQKLDERNSMKTIIEAHIRWLKKIKWRGLTAEKVFEKGFKENDSFHRDTLAKKVPKATKSLITKLMKDIEEEGPMNPALFTTRENTFTLTDYGKCVRDVMFHIDLTVPDPDADWPNDKPYWEETLEKYFS